MLTTPTAERDRIRSTNRGNRVYSIDGHRLPSVTSIVSRGEPKPVLVNWAKKVTAEAAVAQHELVGQLIEADGDRAAIDHLKGAAYRQRDAAGELGSKLHEVAEYEILEGKTYPEPGDPQAQRLLRQYRHFIEKMNPTWHAVEAIVYNVSVGYAGTLDGICSLPAEAKLPQGPVLIDWKSGSGVYGSHVLQLAAYAHAEKLIADTEVDLRDVLPTPIAAVVHITPKHWELVEVDVGDPTFSAFITCRDMATWVDDISQDVVGGVLASGSAPAVSLQPNKVTKSDDALKNFATQRRIKPPSFS